MADTPTTNIGLTKISTGTEIGTWGPIVDANWDLIDSYLGGTIPQPAQAYNPTQIGTLLVVRPVVGVTAAAQINAAVAALPAAGGTILALYGASFQTIDVPLIIGSSTKQVTLIIERVTQFNITVVGGVDAIQLWVESSIVCLDMGNVQSVGNFVVANSANINNIIASYPRAGPTIINVRGFTICGNPTATVNGAALDLIGCTDKSTIQDIVIYNHDGPCCRIRNAVGGVPCGPINIINPSFNGSGLAGAIPLLIQDVAGGGVIMNINIFGGSLTHPGPGGLACASILGTSANSINGVGFYGTQFESIQAADLGISILNATGIIGYGNGFTAAGTAGSVCVKIAASGGGVSYNHVFDGLVNFNAWAITIQNTTNGITITDARPTIYRSLAPGANAAVFDGSLGLIMRMTQDGVGLAGTKLGFYGTAPAIKPNVTGSKGANAALGSLLTALAGLGLLTDSST